MSTSTALVDYVAQRAAILAQLVLTRRKGVRVISFKEPADTGLDFIVQLPPLHPGSKAKQSEPYLGIVVKGTSEPLEDEDQATAYCEQHWKELPIRGLILAPIVYLLFSVEGDLGYFSWLMEPQVKPRRDPSLTRVTSPKMTKINRKSIDAVFEDVEQWYQAMSAILFREK